MDRLNKFLYGDNDLSLKEQVDLADNLLDAYISMINDSLPKVDLWMSGSVLYNTLSIGCGEGVKLELLGKKKILENIENCTGCGRKFDNDTIRWILESYIRAGKKRLNKNELKGNN